MYSDYDIDVILSLPLFELTLYDIVIFAMALIFANCVLVYVSKLMANLSSYIIRYAKKIFVKILKKIKQNEVK